MKNLSAIPRLSLSETFTILITLVVCLAGFTEAEVHANYKRDSSQQEEGYPLKDELFNEYMPYYQQTSEVSENEDKSVDNFKDIPQSPLNKLAKRHSDEFGESDEPIERESDGYGYDDDEYYHFNFKRNDENVGGNKIEKEGVHEMSEKEGDNSLKLIPSNSKEKSNEIETIEMLNYKETHPSIGSETNQNAMDNMKPYSDDLIHKKAPSSSSGLLTSLKINDLRQNSAIDEKMKERKDESGLASGSSDSKIGDSKKSLKVSDEKDHVKLKDSKLTEDSDKKEKEASLKDAKAAVVTKDLKENSKSADEKDKGVKLSDTTKLQENLEKISYKAKENDSPKLAKEDVDVSRYADKPSSDEINPNGLSQINNRASFVSNDYKENMDTMKTAGVEEEEKSSEETNGMGSNVGLNDCQDGLRRSREKLRKFLSDGDPRQNSGSFNMRDNTAQIFRSASKTKDHMSAPFDLQNLNPDLFKKRESWKETGAQTPKFRLPRPNSQQLEEQHEQSKLSQEQMLQQGELIVDPRFKNAYGLSFPTNELENTEYHKNYIKSLKRYKGMSEEQKGMTPETSSTGSVEKTSNNNNDQESDGKKLQGSVKRMSMLLDASANEALEEKENLKNKIPKLRRNVYKIDSLSNQTPEVGSQTLSKSAEDETKLSEGKKAEEPQENNRPRRKSPVKLEYEIKVINQSPQDYKNAAELSHFVSRRFEKDLKTKLATEDKYLKKYPYSQVSRDDLTRLSEQTRERKFKRRAPICKRHDQKSVIQIRAVPSGYYGNRVKFGQKNYIRNNEGASTDIGTFDTGHASPSFLPSQGSAVADKTKVQRSWEVSSQDYKHDPMKRHDESGYMNNGNSLLLVKKGERTATAFEEGTAQSVPENLNPDHIAKILSNDNDYIVLKKTDSNKFQKISEANPPKVSLMDLGTPNYASQFGFQVLQEGFKSSGKTPFKNKELHTRSSHTEKEDKKLSFNLHGPRSSLRKTFEKFRDLAGFFKDNEQESSDNRYSTQELKEGRDIVFSEDKLPDPIVISNDANGKSVSLNQKPQNSIFSISTNFKTLDQQDKKSDLPSNTESDKNMFTESKTENTESSWEPAFKNIFPEAKSINSMSKNGNEIIILDFNRNQLKTDHGYNINKPLSQVQQFGTFGMTSQVPENNPASVPGDKKIQIMMSPGTSKFQPPSNAKAPQKSKVNMQNSKAYAVVRAGDKLDEIAVRSLADLPTVLKALTEKKSSIDSKLLTKRSPASSTNSKVSENYNKFLRELNELSELNSSSYKKGKFTKKRNAKDISLPSSSFPELSTYSDANKKYLGNLLQNIMTGDDREFRGINESPVETSNGGISRYLDESVKSNQMYLNPGMLQPNRNLKYESRWSTAEEKGGDYISIPGRDLGEDKENDILQSEREMSGDKNFQDDFWEELASTSDKINRLRREGEGKRKLRKAIEDSSGFREKHDSGMPNASPEVMSQEKNMKLNPDSEDPSAKDKMSFEERDRNNLKFGSELKSETKEDKSSLKSDYENHLSEFFENLNTNKNQKDQLIIPNEKSWKRKKRKENHRRKRSANRDVKNKVSTTAVQNTILKNLGVDNYQSVYSPGIKRRLFSTNNEADDADNYSDAYERDKNVITEEAQAKCLKNSLNKCIDPMIVELFGAVDEEERSRVRRSLTSGLHSNFKREIDLDESMPNDFQNFLVTSLGGFGSQKREVTKKDVALWEGKETPQDNTNQIIDGSPGAREANEDSTLEKREVPSSENHKSQSYFLSAPSSDSNLADVMDPLNHSQKNHMSEDKSKLKAKAEFDDEKIPTQIRIQITNASSKEKKSSKPIMDERETTSTEMENVPKEKEFFEKNKINNFRVNERPKLHSLSKSKFTFSDYDDPDNRDNGGSQKPYRPYRRRRKKKKYVLENPTKDFIKFDQKTMETFLKRIMNDQNLAGEQTTQRSPVSNHLPQVETVYNPTQGTNKAQLETSRFGKVNSANSKNAATVKNNLQYNEPMGYDDRILRSYLKDKMDKIKGDRVKGFDDIDWKPSSGKMKLGQDLGWEPATNSFNLPTLRTKLADSSFTSNKDTPPYANPSVQHLYGQKSQLYTNNYFFHPSSYSDNTLYDDLKLKQDMKSPNRLTGNQRTSKILKQPLYLNDVGIYKMDEKDNSQDMLFPGVNAGDGIWNYDYPISKKANSQGYKTRDYYTNGIKNLNHLEQKNEIGQATSRKFIKKLEDEKSSAMEIPQSSPVMDGTRDADYLEGMDDEYLDDDMGKDLQVDEPLVTVSAKKPNHLYDTYHRLYNYGNSDVDDSSNEEDEELDDDYEENSEDEDLDDYSLLENSKTFDPEPTRLDHGKVQFQRSFQPNDPLSPINYVFPKENLLELKGNSFEQTEFTNSKHDLKYNQGRQQIPLVDMKSDMGSLSGSTNLLKRANENANIFEKNLVKNTHGYNFDDDQDIFSEDGTKEMNGQYRHNKLMKRKLDVQEKPKRSREYPQIGSRLFYAATTEINDDTAPLLVLGPRKNSRSSKHFYHPLSGCSKCNPLNAEFADTDNGFESESEENDKHFNENIVSFGKKLQDEGKTEQEGDCEEGAASLEGDMAKNLENDGETISEDNVLENVIGKYIMRKRVVSLADLSNSSESPFREDEYKIQGKHRLRKRSLGKKKYSEKTPEARIVKRLSSGHLTEKNYRKYHKKNLNRKREIKDFDTFQSAAIKREGKTTLRKPPKKRGKPTLTKRSALDLFKKITNRDRDNKKVENIDGRTAGFEPLSSLNDKKYESSIRDAKFDFLNQVKKLSSESPQTQVKNNVVELKAHFPNEGPLALDQMKKEKGKVTLVENPVSGTTAQGPWRIELNDNYGLSIADFPKAKSLANVKELKAIPASQESDNLKAFLVFSNNVRSSKRSTAGLPPTSGSPQKEVGNSYGPKSDEGTGIYKMHVKKRSLDSFLVTIDDEDAAQTSRDHFTSQQITETHVNLKEKNRALHDTKSLSEGDSISQLPHVLQRNTKKIRSFVNDDEQCQNTRFPSVGKLNNRKSVFPPSNDVNIMRDSRQVNEEMSRYLGQQIVSAILSHVSANPKFKELIAPGLAVKTAAYKENIEVKQRPLQQVDIPNQLQYFLQKFMLDLEKLAEKHVKKRMCSQIDQQSKHFLQSLLSVPGNTQSGDQTFKGNQNCPISEDYSVLEGVEDGTTTAPALEKPETESPPSLLQNSTAQEIEYLMRKHCLLMKLIDDYEKLSKFEKDSLGVNYQYLMKELDQTNKDLGSLKATPPVSASKFCSRNFQKNSNDISKIPTGSEQAVSGRITNVTAQCRNCSGAPRLKNPPPKWEVISNKSRQPKLNSINNKTVAKAQVLPTLFFEEESSKSQQMVKPTPAAIFEGVDSVNMTVSAQNKKNATQERLQQGEVDSLSPPIPQTFDLLPCQNSTQEVGNLPTEQAPGSSKSVRFKESLSGADTLENSNNRIYNADEQIMHPSRPTELQKLSLGDAAGLQLSLKNRAQWVSNLDVAKVIRNVPGVPEIPKKLSLIKSKAVGSPAMSKTVDAPSVADVKNSRSLIAPSNDYSSFLSPVLQKKDLGFAVSPYFNLGMLMPKRRPFENVSRNFGSLKTDKIPLNYFLKKISTSGRKRVFLRSKYLAPPPKDEKMFLGINPSNRYDIKKSSIFPQSPLEKKKRSNKDDSEKQEGTNNSGNDDDKDAALEYLVWSTMPAVRRQLNNLETGIELDDFFLKNPKVKISKGGGDKPV